jgi:hypothetical protein
MPIVGTTAAPGVRAVAVAAGNLTQGTPVVVIRAFAFGLAVLLLYNAAWGWATACLRRRAPELWSQLTGQAASARFPRTLANPYRYLRWLLVGEATPYRDVELARLAHRLLALTWCGYGLGFLLTGLAAADPPGFTEARWPVGAFALLVLLAAAAVYGARHLLLWGFKRSGGAGAAASPRGGLLIRLAARVLRVLVMLLYMVGLAFLVPVLLWPGHYP